MLRNLKIGSQIGLSFGLILLIMAVVVLFALNGLQTGSQSFKIYRGLARQSVLSRSCSGQYVDSVQSRQGLFENPQGGLPAGVRYPISSSPGLRRGAI